MKVIRKGSEQGKWLLDDGTVPIQMRIVAAEEINSVKHLHKALHEYFYVLSGSMTIMLDDEAHRFETDDILVVEPGESHYIKEMSPDLKLMLLMPPPIPGDKVVV